MNWWLVGLTALVVLCVVISIIVPEMLRRQRVMKHGIPIIAWLVQANNILYEPGKSSAPAQLLISFPGERTASVEQLSELAQQLGQLKSAPAANAMEEWVAGLVIDEEYRPAER